MERLDLLCNFNPTENRKATEALQFYEYYLDSLPYYIAIENGKGFDWDMCRAYCYVGRSYSHSRFMHYVAKYFGTTVKEMKAQWKNIKLE